MNNTPAVSLQGVSKSFGTLKAVDNIGYEIMPGEIFGVIGPNGAGKTTCVNMITGMMKPDAGQVRTLGLDPVRQENELRRILGVQFQEAELPEQITVREAMDLYSSFYSNSADWRKLLADWDLDSKQNDKFGKLSGGQKQRLFICLALINNPKLVVLDELTTGLDPQARRMSWEHVKRIREQGATVLLVTHFMEEAEYLCDRIALINHGRVQALGAPEELTTRQDGQRVVTFTAPEGFDPNVISRLGRVTIQDGQVRVEGGKYLMAEVASALRNLDFAPDDLSTFKPSLEDLFIDLTDATTSPDEGAEA